MNTKHSQPIILKTNLFLNNINDKITFTNNSNITGISLPKFNYSAKNKSLIRSNSITLHKNNFGKTDTNFYSVLPSNQKIKYINNLITNSIQKDNFDYMALKRKKFTLSELIHQFDVSDKSKKLEENKICKIPYPLLYCVTNRKVENNSANLLTKILTKENNVLSKKQELTIKYSQFSKIFNTDISKLINDENTNKTKTPKVQGNFTILNQYLKQKFNNIYFSNININKNKFVSAMSNTPKWTKLNIKKNIRRWNSTNCTKIMKKDKKIQNEEFKNVFEPFKNKSVNLFNHNNNMKNIKMIQDRMNNILEEKFMRNNKLKTDPKVNKIIKDISHLRFNNQLMAFTEKINDV